MPGALRECRHAMCPNYAVQDGYCYAHRYDSHRNAPVSPPGMNLRPANRRFRWMRRAFLNANPMCAVCRTRVATELDHVTPHRANASLFWDQANWQGLCALCHGRKTVRETLHRGHPVVAAIIEGKP